MVLVYDIKDYLNVFPVSKQRLSQVWGDLKRNKKLLLRGIHPFVLQTIQRPIPAHHLYQERTFTHSITNYNIVDNLGLMLKETLTWKLQGTKIKTTIRITQVKF